MKLYLALALMIVTCSCAAKSLENEALERVAKALTEAEAIALEAKGYQKPSQTRFQYDLLAQDINRIKAGIFQKTRNIPDVQVIEPIAGDYIE